MSIFALFTLAVGLSMDAFAVSVCKGLALPKVKLWHMVLVGLWFGGFQALMPAIGYFLGAQFSSYISNFDHWIAFILLGIIGGSMIKEALEKDDEEECPDAGLGVKTMFLMAVATSIDALAVGVTLAFLKVDVVSSVLFIGVVTFVISAVGVRIGNIFGTKYKSKAELLGGIILIILGIKILLEHLMGG
ncbi:MAG TPA: manganese efflux pump [Candidatus Limivivens merdigallinarum]|uniref:Putative manganese efflux pump MntP n=1 Tax=Candidatus Limivivens merdigallinarum TaxID=2840859 RepID=A0A9D0ZXT9_9FIRM|nr:manganese efflux pump [Candidatus Limivivens merdigallinarum]